MMGLASAARRSTLLLTAAATVMIAGAAQAQTVPFGKNKVQYRDFDWHVLAGDHVDVYYYPEEERVARLALAYAEESYRFLERRFRHHPFQRIPLIVYASDRHFEQTNVFPGFIPEGVLGFTEYLKRRIALPFRGDYAQFRRTLRHELVHFFQLSKIAETQTLHSDRPPFSPQDVLWWTEGLAEHWSGDQTVEDRMYVRDALVHGRLPSIERFAARRDFLAYPLGGELHAYLSERFGAEYIADLYEGFWRYDTFTDALVGVLGVELERLERDWRRHLRRRFFPRYSAHPTIDAASEPVVREGTFNRAPALLPTSDGGVADLYFLSSRTGYTNLYRTSVDAGDDGAETVVEGQRRAEFESFHPNESRIDTHDSGLLVFVSEYLARDALFLWDVDSEEVVGRYQWPDLVALRSPSWHPSGDRIVFEGLAVSGESDLYILDLRDQRRMAVTRDPYRDRDPDWSPDGGTIVFTSDRTPFGDEGYTNLYLADVESGGIRPLTYGEWHDRDPRWSRAGDRIAFSSDRAGEYDLHIVDREGRGRQVTAMTGGAFAPVWLPDDAGLVFSGFGDGRFAIYRHDMDRDTAAHATYALASSSHSALVGDGDGLDDGPGESGEPGRWRWSGLDATSVDDAESRPYESRETLALDFAGGDAVLAPGLGSAQGAQVLATDMLGDHMLFGGLSALQSGDLDELLGNFSGRFSYLNLSRRLNFGLAAYRYRGRFRDIAFDAYRESSYGTTFFASYPFSRYRRLELQIGLVRSRRDDLEDGVLPIGVPRDAARGTARDLTRDGILSSNYVSYVKDNTLWLPTGPIDGERYNLTAGVVSCFSCTVPGGEVDSPARYDVTAENFVVLGDYRRYIRTSRRSAYAARAFGYLSGGEIPGRAILGGPHRLRGYPRFSLAGSRAWLVNQEWRFPLLAGATGSLPVAGLGLPALQGALFVDVGSSWLRDRPTPNPWGSYGTGLRMSLGPPMVLRLDVGRRFHTGERPPVRFGPGKAFGSTFVDFFFGYNY